MTFPIAGHVRFDDIAFAYPSRPDVPVLKGVSFEIQPGETVGIVGCVPFSPRRRRPPPRARAAADALSFSSLQRLGLGQVDRRRASPAAVRALVGHGPPRQPAPEPHRRALPPPARRRRLAASGPLRHVGRAQHRVRPPRGLCPRRRRRRRAPGPHPRLCRDAPRRVRHEPGRQREPDQRGPGAAAPDRARARRDPGEGAVDPRRVHERARPGQPEGRHGHAPRGQGGEDDAHRHAQARRHGAVRQDRRHRRRRRRRDVRPPSPPSLSLSALALEDDRP